MALNVYALAANYLHPLYYHEKWKDEPASDKNNEIAKTCHRKEQHLSKVTSFSYRT